MPINTLHPLEKVVEASYDYFKNTNKQIPVNYMLCKNATILSGNTFTNISAQNLEELLEMLDPKVHRLVLCEYNYDPRIGKNDELTPEDIKPLEKLLKNKGFLYKKFVAFGKKDNLACGLLGGIAKPNLKQKEIQSIFKKAQSLVLKR
jgi:adenine C2-methylase RlmN of 23S rRNA A2503 and tRNA A37